MKFTAEQVKRLVFSDGIQLPGNLEALVACQEDTKLPPAGTASHYYRFFYRLFKTLRPALTLELGTSYGHSSACMADANEDGLIVTVNNRDELRQECWRKNVLYKNQDSLAVVPLEAPIDILFIDTDHDGVRCLAEFLSYEKYMAKNSIVFFDDISLNEEMKKFWDSFNPEGWTKFELPAHGSAGFGCLIKTDDDGGVTQ